MALVAFLKNLEIKAFRVQMKQRLRYLKQIVENMVFEKENLCLKKQETKYLKQD